MPTTHPSLSLHSHQLQAERSSGQQQPPVRIYQAYYAASPETAAFQAAVSRESSMFGDLIRAKQHLVLPVDMGRDSLKQVGFRRIRV